MPEEKYICIKEVFAEIAQGVMLEYQRWVQRKTVLNFTVESRKNSHPYLQCITTNTIYWHLLSLRCLKAEYSWEICLHFAKHGRSSENSIHGKLDSSLHWEDKFLKEAVGVAFLCTCMNARSWDLSGGHESLSLWSSFWFGSLVVSDVPCTILRF